MARPSRPRTRAWSRFLDDRGSPSTRAARRGGRIAVRLGLADAIADVVATGTTLAGRARDLRPGAPRSEAVSSPAPGSGHRDLLRRLSGVMVARRYVMIDYDVPPTAWTRRSPSLRASSRRRSRRCDPEWVAVQVMGPRKGVHQVMDALYAIGARAILVTDIHAARL